MLPQQAKVLLARGGILQKRSSGIHPARESHPRSSQPFLATRPQYHSGVQATEAARDETGDAVVTVRGQPELGPGAIGAQGFPSISGHGSALRRAA
jgi:hypothetical protein